MPDRTQSPEVSVVVATQDPGRSLMRCLAALEAQTASPDLEVVVVDDGSARSEVVFEARRAYPRMTFVRQPRRGVAAARNTGARHASGKIVCFTDDDCEPEPEWVERLAATLRGGVDVGGGLTVPGRSDNRFDVATQTIVNALVEPHAGQPSFCPGSNFACWRGVLLAVPFDERFDGAGEDREWCGRVARLGYRLGWERAATVRHHQELDFAAFWRKHSRYGRGAYQLMRSRPPARPMTRYGRILARGFGDGLSVGVLVCLAQLATAAGFVRELVRDRVLAGRQIT